LPRALALICALKECVADRLNGTVLRDGQGRTLVHVSLLTSHLNMSWLHQRDDPTYPTESAHAKLSVGLTGQVYLHESEGLSTQGLRPGRSSRDLVVGIFALNSSDWSNALRYHNFDTRTDTEFKPEIARVSAPGKGTIMLNATSLNTPLHADDMEGLFSAENKVRT